MSNPDFWRSPLDPDAVMSARVTRWQRASRGRVRNI